MVCINVYFEYNAHDYVISGVLHNWYRVHDQFNNRIKTNIYKNGISLCYKNVFPSRPLSRMQQNK